MKNGTARQRPASTHHNPVLLTGSTADKYPVIMDDRKTIIFISDKSKENETRQRFIMQGQQNNSK